MGFSHIRTASSLRMQFPQQYDGSMILLVMLDDEHKAICQEGDEKSLSIVTVEPILFNSATDSFIKVTRQR